MWKARDGRLNRIVALKFILAGRANLPAKELLREARAASALNHPNIVTILEIGEAEGDPYIAMEFVDGETLRSRMARIVPLEESVRIASQVCLALSAAHNHGIVHRDLKPENIMLRVDNFVKLVDFGLAKVLPWNQETASESQTFRTTGEHGAVVGTVSYMSPEQARGQKVEASSDVFSFGIVFYELLTGRHPFRGETPMDTLNAILTAKPDPVNKVRPEVPMAISDLVDRCLRKQPGDRYSAATEISERLDPALTKIGDATGRVRPKPSHSFKLKTAGLVAAAAILLALVWFVVRPWLGIGSAQSQIRSVAVMNIKVPQGDSAGSVFSEDLSQGLGSALTERGLLVAGRSTIGGLDPSTDPRSIGKALNVDAVIQGDIHTVGNNLRLYLELVDARTGFQVWSRTTPIDADALLGPAQETIAKAADQIAAAAKGQR